MATPPQSDFYGKDITLNPIKADLSKKQSVYMIAQYCADVRTKIMKQWYDNYIKKNGDPPP